jgi:hypothetical protein
MARKPVTDMSAWPSLSLEGNLIAPAMVASIDRQQASGQAEEDYRIRKGLTIREEISTSFRVGQSHFDAFARLQNPSVEATRRYMRAFLAETFGFDDLVPADDTISFLAGGRVPVVVVPPSEEKLDRRSPTLSTDRSRSPAFALQDYLNDHDDALWGLVTNGTVLRLMRDNASLTRPAYIEADLAQIFTNEDAASFAVLWSLIHRTRFGAAGAPATDCALERWRDAGSREGEAARDRLAAQVEIALRVLGSGFLEANPDLATRLKSGEIDLTEWFNELLRLVYRLIFLMVAEDRNLLHAETATQDARKLYREGYSLAALRASCVRAATWDKHHDRYEGVKIVFRALAHGQEALGLTALGGLFNDDKLPHLETARLRNRTFMEALYRLSWLSDKTGMTPVNWRVMETEELGSVYESLLELQPQLGQDGKTLLFASEASEQKGNQRKTTGSYYTPDSLVQALLDTALDPVLEKTEAEADDPAAALLKLSVIDPACGSGHFLLAAARRIATRIARIRADGTPSLTDFRHALRDVARFCLHGVDRNPMAVELTKVALWIETVDPGLPLGFFDAQIRCGDALLGVFDLKVLEDGVSDAAYKPLTGDDKDTAKYYARANRDEKAGQGSLDFTGGRSRLPAIRPIATEYTGFRALGEDTLDDIIIKDRRFRSIRESEAFHKAEMACDLYIAAFLLPKIGGAPTSRGTRLIPTTSDVWQALDDGQVWGPIIGQANISRRARAFHWPLEFPDVMQRGGFDVVLGNPPWERVKLQEEEFFALRDAEIATAKNAAARKRLIDKLDENNPRLANEWRDALRSAATESHFMRESGRFPRGGVGDVNTYAVFTDHFWQLTKPTGYAGLIIPTGLVSGFTYRAFLGELLSTKSLVAFYGFENEDLIFPHITNKVKFGLLTMAGRGVKIEQPWFTAHIRQPSEIADPEKRYALTIDEIRAINPNTLNLPAFRWSKDAKVTASIHMAAPILIEKDGNTVTANPWNVTLKTLFHMSGASEHFIDHEAVAHLIQERRGALAVLSDGRQIYPLYEGKMFWHFDHRYGTYENQTEQQSNKGVLPRVNDQKHLDANYQIQPRYWVDSKLTLEALDDQKHREWSFSWRDVGPSERTFVGTAIPKTAAGDTAYLLCANQAPKENVALVGVLGSLVCDYAARQKSSRMKYFVVEQIPTLSPEALREPRGFLDGSAVDWLSVRVLELCYTNHEMLGLADDMNFKGGPFRWDPERRVILQAEIDAALLHLYGLTKEQGEILLDSFAVLRKYEERDHGEFRTRELVLTAYDAMAEAKAAGTAFVSPLSPPPADPSLCHWSSVDDTPRIDLPVLGSLPNGAWSWPASVQPRDRLRYAAQYALWLADSAVDANRTRFLIACLAEPALLTPMLTGSDRDQWIRLVGSEAQLAQGVVRLRPVINQVWSSMFETLITSGQLVERSDGAWARGPHFSAAGLDTNSIHAQRTAFAIAAVRGMEIGKLTAAVAQDDNVIWARFGHG